MTFPTASRWLLGPAKRKSNGVCFAVGSTEAHFICVFELEHVFMVLDNDKTEWGHIGV